MSRVRLRALALSDVETLVAYRNDPVVVRYQSWSSYTSEEGLALVRAMLASSGPGVDGEWYQWGIEVGGDLVGDVGLRTFDEARQGEIGFTLAPAGRGKGYGFDACSLVLDLAFIDLKFHRVIAAIDPANAAAGTLLSRLGFRREGLEKASVFLHGEWLDDERWAMLAEEFRARS